MDSIKELIPFLVPLAALQFGLQIYSIINLVRRHKVRFLNKPLWAVVILAFGVIGAGSYLVLRGDDE
jgi:hypothetical protein